MLRVKIEKLIFGGQALGRIGNKVCFVWGALPGEEVEFSITKSKKNFIEGIVTKILTPAEERMEPDEDHYLCCSPWSVMPFVFENEWKKKIAIETYEKLGALEFKDIELAHSKQESGYRNKMEFSFINLPNGKLSLAFFTRGGQHHVAIEECKLAMPEINKAAQKIVAWANEQSWPNYTAKSVILRVNQNGKVIAAVFVRVPAPCENFPKLDEILVGFQLYYSSPLGPASTPDKLLHEAGQKYLEDKLLGTKLRYGVLSFFQVNPPMFELALRDIAKFLERDARVVDYYCGVGSISLPLAKIFKDLTLVENNVEAKHYAQENIELNKLKNAQAYLLDAAHAEEYLAKDKIVIVDPPRIGLEKQMRYNLIKTLPRRIIYLSCDLATQARDLKELSPFYQPVFKKLYNFFPKTPHIEGLVVLGKK